MFCWKSSVGKVDCFRRTGAQSLVGKFVVCLVEYFQENL